MKNSLLLIILGIVFLGITVLARPADPTALDDALTYSKIDLQIARRDYAENLQSDNFFMSPEANEVLAIGSEVEQTNPEALAELLY